MRFTFLVSRFSSAVCDLLFAILKGCQFNALSHLVLYDGQRF